MTGFNDMTTSNHCGFFLDLTRDVLLKGKATTIPSPFKRQLKSKSPKSVRKYKHYLQKQVIKNNVEKQIEHILITSKQRKLTQEEEIDLNRIDQLITKIMLKAEKCINNQQHNFPWSPALHDTIRNVSIWKSILSQFKTKPSRGIARICGEYKLFDPLDHKHGNTCDSKSCLRGSDRIDFFFVL